MSLVQNHANQIDKVWTSKTKYDAHIDVTHRISAEKISSVAQDRQALMENMRLKRSPNAKVSEKSKVPARLNFHELPQLRFEEISRIENDWRNALTSRSVVPKQLACSLEAVLTNRSLRKDWLRMTEPLKSESLLMPYSLQDKNTEVARSLTTPERMEEESVVWSESKRICAALKQINFALRRPTDECDAISSNLNLRSEKLKNISDDLQAVSKKAVSIVQSLGVKPPRAPRFDFITANKDHTFLGKMNIRRARTFRKSVEGVEKSLSVIERNISLQAERNERIYDSISLRGKYKSTALTLDSDLQQRSFLTFVQLACFTAQLASNLCAHRASRVGSAVRIQRTWRHYVSVSKTLVTWAVSVISRWVCKVIVRFRQMRKHRAANKIRVFMSETKKSICICQAVPAFLKFKMKVKRLQTAVRVYLDSVMVLRAKYMLHFERVEDAVLRGLIRENIRHLEKERGDGAAAAGKPEVKTEKDGRAKRGALTPVKGLGGDSTRFGGAGSDGLGPGGTGRGSKSAQEARLTVDWSGITDLSKFRTPDDMKRVVVAAAVRSNRLAFVERKQAWHEQMREYKAHFRQTVLFRANVDDFLASTGQEHKAGALDSLVGAGPGSASFQSLIAKMNRKIPQVPPRPPPPRALTAARLAERPVRIAQRPAFREMLSDERMRDLVMQVRAATMALILGVPARAPAVGVRVGRCPSRRRAPALCLPGWAGAPRVRAGLAGVLDCGLAAGPRRSPALLIHGRLERAQGVVNITAERVEPLALRAPVPGSRDFR